MLLKNILAHSGVNLFSQILLFGQNFVVRGLLAPQIMGIWNYVGVVQGFLSTFDLGINAAAIRELPLLRGQGHLDEEARARATAYWSSLAQGLLFMTLILGYLAIGWQGQQHKASLMVAAVLVVGASLKDCLVTFLQGSQQYVPLSRAQFFTVIFQVLAVCLGAYLGGIYGLMLGAVLVQILLLTMLWMTCLDQGLSIRYPWSWRIFKRQAGFGLPLRLVDYPMSLFSMLDLLCVTRYFSIETLGLYATGRLIAASAGELLARMNIVIITRINQLGATGTGRLQVVKELRLFLYLEYLILLPLIVSLGFLVSSMLIGQFLPKYVQAIGVAQILLVSLFFIPQTTLVRNFWILDKRLVSLGLSNLVGLIAGLGALLLVAKFSHLTMTAVAWALVAGFMVYYLYIMLSVGRETWGLGSALGLCLTSFGSATLTAVLLFYLDYNFVDLTFGEALTKTLTRVAIILIIMCPLFFIGLSLLIKNNYLNLKSLFTSLANRFKST